MLDNNSQLLTIPIKLQDEVSSTTLAVFDTGANCSCVSHHFAKTQLTHLPLTDIHNKVQQASGESIGAIGYVNLSYMIEDACFYHKFIVCTKLTTPVILGLDFAKTYHIGIDWNMDSVPYLCH